MALFKYMQKQYLDAFFRRGSLKIGTLYEYRNVEGYGSVIGDSEEGTFVTTFEMPGGGLIDLNGESPEAQFFREHSPLKSGTLVVEDGAIVEVTSHNPNIFIYCASSVFDQRVMEEFGCDSCLEIVNPVGFLKAVSRVIRHKADFLGAGNIRYQNKVTEYINPHSSEPCMIKGPEYSYQKEIRAVWAPKRATVDPLFIEVKDAVKFCRRFR